MGLEPGLVQRIAERDRRLEAMTAEACIATASMLRDAKPRVQSDRQRELAEEIAAEFEARAATRAASS
jgi:hypothetical protein